MRASATAAALVLAIGGALNASPLPAASLPHPSTFKGIEVMSCDSTQVPYRIPAIATVGEGPHKGRLVAVADYRFNRGDIGIKVDDGPIDLRVSYSDDNGRTWSEPAPMTLNGKKPVSRGTGRDKDFYYAFGDPAIVADRESGRLLVMSCAGVAGFWGGRRNAPQQVAKWWSEDGGETWTEVEDGTDQIYSLFDDTTPWGYIDSMFFGSGRIMQSRNVKKGDTYRLYAVLSAFINDEKAGRDPKNFVLYSDDFGKTWNILGDPMTPPVPGMADEPKAEELPDGSVLLAGRGFRGGRNYNIYKYDDAEAATGTWGEVFNTHLNNPNPINACNGEILIIPVKSTTSDETAYMAIQTYPFGPGRQKVGLSWKILDQLSDFDTPEHFGSNWEGRYQISDLPSCYTTLTLQDDGSIGCLYEEDRYGCYGGYCIVYQNLTVNQITDGKWTITTDPDNLIAQRVSTPVATKKKAKTKK
ncbi:MAG: glycoside hydrolase [Paramuribaculum sp.]|nr:glycoside hydrolase [Paramuribaculum sp.]